MRNKFNCETCGIDMNYKDEDQEHIMKICKEVYKCEQCAESFNHEETMVIHMRNSQIDFPHIEQTWKKPDLYGHRVNADKDLHIADQALHTWDRPRRDPTHILILVMCKQFMMHQTG